MASVTTGVSNSRGGCLCSTCTMIMASVMNVHTAGMAGPNALVRAQISKTEDAPTPSMKYSKQTAEGLLLAQMQV